MAKKPERQSAAKALTKKSCNTTNSPKPSLIPAPDPNIIAEREKLLAQVKTQPHLAICAARSLYIMNERGHRARLRSALTVAYAYARRIVDHPEEIARLYKDPLFSTGKKPKVEQLLLNTLFFVVGGNYSICWRYNKALKEPFKGEVSVAEVERRLDQYGIERLYREALAETRSRKKPKDSSDASVAKNSEANEEEDNGPSRMGGALPSSKSNSAESPDEQAPSAKAKRTRHDEIHSSDPDTNERTVDILVSLPRFERMMELGVGATATVRVRRLDNVTDSDWHRFKCISLKV